MTVPPSSAPAIFSQSIVYWLALLWRRRWLVLLPVFLLPAVALISSLLSEERVEIITALEIGTRSVDSRSVPIESPDSCLAKLNEAYIPAVLQLGDGLEGTMHPAQLVSVSNPRNSLLVVLRSTASKRRAAWYQDLQRNAAIMLVADHKAVVDVLRSGLERDKRLGESELATLRSAESFGARLTALDTQLSRSIVDLRNDIEDLTAQLRVLDSQAKALEDQKAYAGRRIVELRQLIESQRELRMRAATAAKSPTDAMTYLLIDSESQRADRELAEYEKLVLIEIPQRQSEHAKRVEQVQREIVLKRESLAATELAPPGPGGSVGGPGTDAAISGAAGHANSRAAPEIAGLRSQIVETRVGQLHATATLRARLDDLGVHLANLRGTRLLFEPRIQALGGQRVLWSILVAGAVGLCLGLGAVVALEAMDQLKRASVQRQRVDIDRLT